MEIAYKNGMSTIRFFVKHVERDNFLMNCEEFIAEGTLYRFCATHLISIFDF